MGLAQSQGSVTYAPASNRLDAIFRLLLALLYTWTIWQIVSAIGIIAGLLFFLVDFFIQLITGGGGYSSTGGSGTFSMWAYRLFLWPLGQFTYIILGGTFPVLP